MVHYLKGSFDIWGSKVIGKVELDEKIDFTHVQ